MLKARSYATYCFQPCLKLSFFILNKPEVSFLTAQFNHWLVAFLLVKDGSCPVVTNMSKLLLPWHSWSCLRMRYITSIHQERKLVCQIWIPACFLNAWWSMDFFYNVLISSKRFSFNYKVPNGFFFTRAGRSDTWLQCLWLGSTLCTLGKCCKIKSIYKSGCYLE